MTYGKKPFKSSDNNTRPKKSNRFGARKGSGNRSSSGSRSGSTSKRPIKKFDPSLFIKKVEEQVKPVVSAPEHSFADFKLTEQLYTNICDKGYEEPTPIQDQVIPIILTGSDVIATANTGTGKTAAFLIPLLQNYIDGRIKRVVILTPTRELALQIYDECRQFAQGLSITSALCIGGANMSMQISALKNSPIFVIGTPGRLLDIEQNGYLRFSEFDSVVLDEVDTMLAMGFIKDIRFILKKLPKKRQSLFFSATISPEIKEVMNEFLHNPISVTVKTRESGQNVNQEIIKVGSKHKIDLLHDLLINQNFTRVLIFLRTKWAVDKLAKALTERGFKVAAIHGDKTQASRNRALDLFKNNDVPILIATDVVARGIDIDEVSHVINYDMPATSEDYIHRIGRTGRADHIGHAITFVD